MNRGTLLKEVNEAKDKGQEKIREAIEILKGKLKEMGSELAQKGGRRMKKSKRVHRKTTRRSRVKGTRKH